MHDMSGYRQGGNPMCGINEGLLVNNAEMLFGDYVKFEQYDTDMMVVDGGIYEGVGFLMNNQVVIKRLVETVGCTAI